jgi:predicted Zn-dependent peptidase
VGVGSRDEAPSLAGASHYLEHLLFKGTQRRDALDISAAIDAVGGEMNAFTSKEYTCFYARVLDTDLPLAVDVVGDLVTSSVIRAADVDAERGVILEEIAMHEDDPTDMVHDQFAQVLFDGGALARPVLGTVESIETIGRSAINGYYRRRYRPQDMVVAVAGNVDHNNVVRLVKKAFGAAGMLDGVSEPTAARRGKLISTASGVLNAALGGGMSSRLFQEVREKRGLAYSVYSYHAQYADTGLFGVYAGCVPRKVDDVLAICREELDKVAASGITFEELERGKGQLRGSMVLGLEDTGSRMSRIGKAELVYGEQLSVDDVLARIDSVTLDEVTEVAADVLSATPTLAVVGPFDEDRDFSKAVA